jgi:hypothetical protein
VIVSSGEGVVPFNILWEIDPIFHGSIGLKQSHYSLGAQDICKRDIYRFLLSLIDDNAA